MVRLHLNRHFYLSELLITTNFLSEILQSLPVSTGANVPNKTFISARGIFFFCIISFVHKFASPYRGLKNIEQPFNVSALSICNVKMLNTTQTRTKLNFTHLMFSVYGNDRREFFNLCCYLRKKASATKLLWLFEIHLINEGG